jgi:hypothetical protein
MLLEQTMTKLNVMKLHGMAKAVEAYLAQPQDPPVSPVDLLGLLVDAEWSHRESRKLDSRLKQARLKLPACIEDIDYRHARGLSKAAILDLASSHWAQAHQNIILTGPTGVGKSYLACALGQKACRDGFSVVYRRASRLFDELALACHHRGSRVPESTGSPGTRRPPGGFEAVLRPSRPRMWRARGRSARGWRGRDVLPGEGGVWSWRSVMAPGWPLRNRCRWCGLWTRSRG